MKSIELKLIDDHAPNVIFEYPEWFRTMACVHPQTGERRMPTAVDDAVFDQAADFIENALKEIFESRDQIATKDAEIARLREALEPRVKPLVWDANMASSPVGTYRYGRVGGEWTLYLNERQIKADIQPDFQKAESAARSAAQADYEARILSALSTIPDPVGGMPVEVER